MALKKKLTVRKAITFVMISILLVSLVGAIVIANTPAETETETDRPAA